VIEQILIICAITAVAPFYDCPPMIDGELDMTGEQWIITVFSTNNMTKICNDDDDNAIACANYGILWKAPEIKLSQNYSNTNPRDGYMLKNDRNVLWHEIMHLTCKCNFHPDIDEEEPEWDKVDIIEQYMKPEYEQWKKDIDGIGKRPR